MDRIGLERRPLEMNGEGRTALVAVGDLIEDGIHRPVIVDATTADDLECIHVGDAGFALPIVPEIHPQDPFLQFPSLHTADLPDHPLDPTDEASGFLAL